MGGRDERDEEPGDGPVILGDYHTLAGGETVNQLRQLTLLPEG